MDPGVPWSAYASYNRLAGVQAGPGTGDLHHHHHLPSPGGAPPVTTAQLLPGSFLPPAPPVSYDAVFSPLFHHAGTKPTHYVTQHRALAQVAPKQAAEGDYHQPQAFFEQGPGTWQQNSPFGILPHESVAPTTTTSKTPYENFNAHFAAAQNLNHLAAAKTAAGRAQSPAASKTQPAFFQVPENNATTKSFASSNSASNIQQTCIVSSPSITAASKEYRIPQAPTRAYLTPPGSGKQPNPAQIQTKAQTKIYPEAERHRSNDEAPSQTQATPASFSIDGPSRLSYAGNNASPAKRAQFQYRHYQNKTEPKGGPDYNSNGPDCNVVVPRRPSPLQAHSQASPLGHAPSPAYPMYNSPMNSIASPQQSSGGNQVTPPSPLDVTVPRQTAQTANVAYPSVITRALNNDKSFPDRYERNQAQNNQNCWEERQQARKFATNQNNSNSYNSTNSIEQRVAAVMSDRQQNYFDSNVPHQVTLQDLTSCRGDPMSLVKNLQQQQSCQVAQVEVKQEVKVPVKRRKSSEKSGVETPGRIPPPAHTSGGAPQQQNGAYFDFDRWNLPPPNSKIFPPQNIHPQHQGLMVPHPHGHHPPPPLPYFAPFHLPHHGEYPSTVELPPLVNYPDPNLQQQQQQQQQQHHPHFQQPQEDQPKVVVPNIEEELNFLSQGNTTRAPSHNANRNKLATKASAKGPAASDGFMSSYLKFLQGDSDSSPAQTARGSRKSTWQRPKPQVITEEKPLVSNGAAVAQPPVAKRLSQGDPQDDPRYFPLPKERKRNSFDSDDGVSSDEDFFNNKKFTSNNRKEKKSRKPASSKKTSKKSAGRAKDGNAENLEIIPRRESSKRAAKDKSNLHNFTKADDDVEEPPEFQDSDSDPAWTPQAKDDGEEILPVSSKKIRRGNGRKRKNLITAAAQGAGIKEYKDYSCDTAKIKKAPKTKQSIPPTLEDNIAASLTNNTPILNDENPFKPGEFVAIRSELSQEFPAIWRVDGKTLLQKYEPFQQNNATFYRNISTYTSWTPESKKQYILIPVKYKVQTALETIVEFLRNEIVLIDHEFHDQCMKDCEGYQDNFEVYIQTLISQALDSNFLTEIFQERDDYFLTNVKTIDDITDSKKKKLLAVLRWPPAVQAAVCTWPCFNVSPELNVSDAQVKSCAACGRFDVALRVLMYGQPYNSTTLEGCQPDPKAMNEKNFLMCKICAERVELSNKVTHQKYLMYIECAKRVSGKRSTDPNKDTTCILNELLADENWLNQLFYEVRTSWAEIDCLDKSLRIKNDTVYTQ